MSTDMFLTAPTRQETLPVPVLKDILVTGSPAQVASAICQEPICF